MGYSENDAIVRVDRFKPSGKWYDSHAIDMTLFYAVPIIHDAVRDATMKQLNLSQSEFERWVWVCLEPHHKHSHPIILKAKEA